MEPVESLEQLESLCKHAALQLLYCDTHFICAGSFGRSTKYDWAIDLQCSICKVEWSICQSCNIRAKMLTARQLQLHHKRWHSVSTSSSKSCTRRAKAPPAPSSRPDSSTTISTSSNCKKSCSLPTSSSPRGSSATKQATADAACTTNHYDSDEEDGGGMFLQEDEEEDNNIVVPVQINQDIIVCANQFNPGATTRLHSSPIPTWGIPREGQIFFKNLHETNKALGYLVGQAHFLLPNVGDALEIETIQLYLHYGFLLRKLSPKLQLLVSQLLKDYDNFLSLHHNRCHSNSVTPFTSIRQIPYLPQDIRSAFFKGKYSIFTNLPVPQVHRCPLTSHSYVLPSQVLAWFFGFAKDITPIIHHLVRNHDHVEEGCLFPLQHFSDTRRMQSILSEKPGNLTTIFLTEWGDDFEPNYGSHNRGSVFIKTITLVTRGMVDSPSFTFPIILGRKGDDHNLIEKIIQKDLLQLITGKHPADNSTNSGYNSTNSGNKFRARTSLQPLQVSVHTVAAIYDQPARREHVGLAAGNGTFTARWGYVGNWGQQHPYIPCCDVCFRHLKDLSTHDPLSLDYECHPLNNKCTQCSNWILDIYHPLLHYDKPVNYPQKGNPPSPELPVGTVECFHGKLQPFKIDFKFLTQAVQYTHNQVIDCTWSIKEAKVYLKTIGLSLKTIEEVIDCADNCMLIEDQSVVQSEELRNYIATEKEQFPNKFRVWEPPVSWLQEYGISLYNNAPMHLLSGVAKTTLVLALEWMKPTHDEKRFVKYTQEVMDQVSSLGLSWCRLPPKFGGKFVGALSENKVNLTRLCCWLFSTLPRFATFTKFQPPSIPQDKWLKKHNVNWLKERGLNSKGSADVVRERVSYFMALPEQNIPRPLWESRGHISLPLNLLHRMHVMFAWVLKSSFNCKEELFMIDVKVRVFLQYFHMLDQQLIKGSGIGNHFTAEDHEDINNELIAGQEDNNSDDVPVRTTQEYLPTATKVRLPHWITSYNFLSLLNLREDIECLGPLRTLWEGGFRGEKYVAEVKPMINHGLTKDWSLHLMKRLWTEKSTEEVEKILKTEATSSGNAGPVNQNAMERSAVRKMFFRYETLTNIAFLIGKKQPLSVLIKSDTSMYFVVQARNGSEEARAILCSFTVTNDYPLLSYYGMRYQHLNCSLSPNECHKWNDKEIVDYGILLPLLHDDTPTRDSTQRKHVDYYTMITYEWDETCFEKNTMDCH